MDTGINQVAAMARYKGYQPVKKGMLQRSFFLLVLLLTISVNLFGQTVIWSDDFETDKGWTLGGEFERGTPQGLGGAYGNSDPSSAYQGSYVLGTDLTGIGTYDGDYEVNLTDRQYYAISPVINCSSYSGVILQVQRWLNVESSTYDHAYIDISTNSGSTWNNVWANTATTITDNAWSSVAIDISAYADNSSTVQIRFAIGITDGSWQYSGWNIDDLRVIGFTPLAGDYRSRQTGDWNNSGTWQYFNGSSWVNASNYPGQASGTGVVFIRSGHTVTLATTPAYNIGSLVVSEGTLQKDNSNTARSLSMTNDFSLISGTVNLRRQNGTITLNVGGDFSISGGTLNCSDGNNISSTVNVSGNYTQDGGTITETGNNSASGNFIFNGSSTHTFIKTGGTISNTINFTVNSPSTLDMGTYVLDGSSGTFTLSSGATLTTANADGVYSSGAVGSIQTTTRVFNSGANYVYNGSTAQITGTFTTTPTAATVNNLTINNTSNVSLSGSLTVSGTLYLTAGNLKLQNNNLTITSTASNAIQGSFSATNMVETNGTGYLIRPETTTTPILFPIGSDGYYDPYSISSIATTTSGTVSARTERNTSLGSNYLERFWDVLTSLTNRTITATFTYNAAEIAKTPTNIYFKAPSGTWQDPAGTQSFGTNSFTITGTTDITSTSTYWTTGPIPDTYFSYQTGSWNNPTTWTSDPGGTTQVGTTIPSDDDVVVILSGRTVTLPSNITTANLEVNINEGGILDMSTYSFSSGLLELNGQGTLRLASVNFPTATTNAFVNSGGGTTEYYNSSNFTLPVAQTTYNHLKINAPGVIATQMSNIILNGNLLVKQGTYKINDNTSALRELTINGNVTVDAGASITVGTGATNSTTDPTAVSEGGTAPFINYYYTQSHTVIVKGDFTNNGTVKFTNQNYPVYNAFPANGFATVYFQGATSNTLTCNGTTDFYNLVLDKGVDQSFALTVYSSAYANFKLFGANTAGGYGGGSNPNLNKALWIRTGTLVLQGLTIIPSLSEGTGDSGTSGPNSDFYIPANGALVLDGTSVVVLSTADDYREVNVAYGVSGGSGLANGVGVGGSSSFSVYGKFQVNNGYFSTRESGGLITWNVASGQFVIRGGTLDSKQFRSAGTSGGLASYDQSGGTLFLRGRFQRTPSAYTSVSDLVNAPISTVRANEGSLGATLGTFNLNEVENVFTMSGGTIRIYDACGTGGRVFDVLSSSGNINVTGGTVEFIPTTGTVTADATIHYVRSNASFGNVIVNRASSTTTVQLDTYPLTVLGNLTLTSGVLTANDLNVTVGGNFSIASGTTYTPGTNWTIFNGPGAQSFTVNTASTLALKKLKIDKPAGKTLTLTGSQTAITVQDSLMLLTGNLADGGKTLTLTTSSTTTASYLYNSGVHSGTGKIVLADDDPQVISGDGNGVFQNLEINNTDALTAPVSLGANITVNGTLTLSQDKLFSIGTYKVTLGASATISGAGSARYIQTAGNAGDGGITKVYSSSSTSFTFPFGAPSTSHAAANYTPATIAFGTAPTTYGSITVIPVGYEHPNTTTKGRSLTYFWRVKSSGFTLGSATVTHSYTYSQNDVVTGTGITENEYVAAKYSNTTFTWTSGAATDVDETNNIIGGTGTIFAGVNYIDGEYTAGDNNPTNPFGTPVKYYSVADGLWGNASTWSFTSGGTAGAGIPGQNDVVIIENNHTVQLNHNGTNYPMNYDVRNCASLQIKSGSTFDINSNTASNFGMVISNPGGNGVIRVTTQKAPSSSVPQFFTFPAGDFSDFNLNGGTTEYYDIDGTAGALYILPANVSSYGNLILTAKGGDNLVLPNRSDLIIYGDLTCTGDASTAWIALSWSTNVAPYNTNDYITVEKTIHVTGNLYVNNGTLIYMDDIQPQHLIVDGDITVAATGSIVANAPKSGYYNIAGMPQANTLAMGGSLFNNANSGSGFSVDLRNTSTLGGATNGLTYYCDVTFFGSNSAYIANTSGTPSTTFNNVTVNKGASQETTLTCTIGGTLSTLTDAWLTLQNGTLRYMRTDPGTDFTITTSSTFTIPSTAGLYIDYPNNASNRNILIANSGSNANDLYLNGKLTVIAGKVYVGPTSGTSAYNNDIEYSGGGAAAIDVQGGNLVVNGQIRRNPATTNGILSYTQSGGNVVINGQAAITSNAKLEVCNTGSVFNMSGGTITIVRGGGGNTYGDLYIRAASSTVTGGDIIFTQTPSIGPAVDLTQNYILDANVALNNLTITGDASGTTHNATVTILISPLTLNGNLTLTNAYSILDMNSSYDIDLTVKGGFTNNGAYNHYNNLTTFSGGAQTIAGSSATDFYDLLVNPVTSLSLIRDIDVFNDLTLSSGQLLYSTYNINLKGDLINNANYDGNATQGGVILNGSALQYISGTGTFGRLELNNSSGARVENSVTLQKNLKLSSGILDINQYLLTLEASSAIEGSSFSSSKMVTSDGAFSNVGIRKYFSVYSGSAQTFTYPMGTSGKYTPVVLTYTDNTNVGYIRVNNINDNHPGVLDPNNVLDYYWEVESNGISGFEGSLVLNYLQEDVQVTGTNTEADYIAAGLLIPGTSWTKAASGSATDNVDEANNTITFGFSAANSLSGEYTAGIDSALPDEVPEFTSLNDGNWSNKDNWHQTGGDPYTLTGAPNGFIIIIDSDDEVTTDINYASAYRITINGTLKVVSPTFGHNLGTVSGSGTLYLESGTIPAGRYTDFFDCSSNATLEYGGTTSYSLIAALYSFIPKLHFTGTGIRTLPSKDLTICHQLLIDGPTLDNSTNNKKLTIQGTMERYNTGAFISGSGPGAIVSFAGSSAQTIGGSLGNFTGSNAFNHFEINNSTGLTVNSGGAVEVAGNLLLTSGNIVTTSTNKLTITNTSINCVTPSGGSSSSYVDGPLIKKINQGDSFLFPIGKGSTLGNKITLSSTQTGTILWTVEFFTPNSTYTSYTSPLTYVNSREYWTVSATAGSQAIVNLNWDSSSDLTPLMTENGLSDMRVANYNTGTTSWEELASAATGNSSSGTVYTTSRVTVPAAGLANYTLACINTIKPRARLSPPGPVCGSAGIPVSFIGATIPLNYILGYKIDGIAQTPVTITTIPYTLPTGTTGATYTLTSFTYNNPGTPTTGVVDPTPVTTYTVPTTANAGIDQSWCGATTATLAGNTPSVGSGLWSIVTGTGGTVVTPTVPASTFNGTNGTSYTLRWTITNGGCSSSDNVVIAFPLLPEKPTAFVLYDDKVCQGDNDVDYSVVNNPSLTYHWSYSGTGYVLTGTGNAITVDYGTTATSGDISVYTHNGCGDSAPLTLAVTVNTLPVFTITGSSGDICDGDLFSLTTTFTSINTPYSINIIKDGSSVTGYPLSSSSTPSYVYNENLVWLGPSSGDSHSYSVTVVDNNGCTDSSTIPVTVDVWKIPETGPEYHIPNNYGM